MLVSLVGEFNIFAFRILLAEFSNDSLITICPLLEVADKQLLFLFHSSEDCVESGDFWTED
jgi:hypothetical protein